MAFGVNYYAKIKASDNVGNLSDWSAWSDGIFVNTVPGLPDSLLANSNVNPINLGDATPDLSAVYRDADSGDIALKYRVQVNNTSNFSGTMLWDSGVSGTNLSGTGCLVDTLCTVTYSGNQLSGGVTYYWRIKFWDSSNVE